MVGESAPPNCDAAAAEDAAAAASDHTGGASALLSGEKADALRAWCDASPPAPLPLPLPLALAPPEEDAAAAACTAATAASAMPPAAAVGLSGDRSLRALLSAERSVCGGEPKLPTNSGASGTTCTPRPPPSSACSPSPSA